MRWQDRGERERKLCYFLLLVRVRKQDGTKTFSANLSHGDRYVGSRSFSMQNKTEKGSFCRLPVLFICLVPKLKVSVNDN